MPGAYEIDPQRGLVISRWWGVTDDEELIGHYERLRRVPAFDPTYWEPADVRDVERYSTAGVTIEAVARVRIVAAGVRRAAIAPNDVAFGLARMFATYAESQDHLVEVFRARRRPLHHPRPGPRIRAVCGGRARAAASPARCLARARRGGRESWRGGCTAGGRATARHRDATFARFGSTPVEAFR